MALADVSVATKFVKTLAGNSGLRVKFIEGLKVPTADTSGEIQLPPPTIDTLTAWNRSVHHELSHCFPELRYHFDAIELVPDKKMILNLLVDNLAEAHKYDLYKGRQRILSTGLYELMQKRSDWFTPASSPSEHLLKGFMAWDCHDRSKWMGYPMSQFLSPRDKFKDVIEHLDGIKLRELMDTQKTKEDIADIVNKICSFLDDKPKPDEEDTGDDGDPTGSGTGDDEDSGEPGEPGEAGGSESEGKGSEDSSDGSVPNIDGDSDSDPKGDIDGKSEDDERGQRHDVRNPSTGTSYTGSDNSIPKADGGDLNGTDSVDGVENGDQTENSSPENDEGSNDCPSGQEGSDGGNSEPDNSGEDSGTSYSPTVEPTKPGYSEDGLTKGCKALMEDYFRNPDVDLSKAKSGYIPITMISWVKLSHRVDAYRKKQAMDVKGNSKVSRSIQKHLQALNTKSYSYGQKSGRLANKSLFKTQSGSRNVFKRQNAQRLQKDTAVTILMDCSGSMVTAVGSDYSKLVIASASCTILAETLRDLRIPYEILGFTEESTVYTDGGVQMYEFKSFSENIKPDKVMDRICSIPETNNNADAESLLEAASRLSVRRETNKLLIVLSDGNPVGYFTPGQGPAKAYLKHVCNHLETETDIDLMAVGICSDKVEQFYKNCQVIWNAEKLDEAIMTLLKTRVTK